MKLSRTVISIVWVALVVLVMFGCGSRADDPGMEPVTVTLNVAGMTCESCEQAIVETVGQLQGVDMVESRHVTGTATVLYRPGTISKEAIIESIEGMGYKVLSPEG